MLWYYFFRFSFLLQPTKTVFIRHGRFFFKSFYKNQIFRFFFYNINRLENVKKKEINFLNIFISILLANTQRNFEWHTHIYRNGVSVSSYKLQHLFIFVHFRVRLVSVPSHYHLLKEFFSHKRCENVFAYKDDMIVESYEALASHLLAWVLMLTDANESDSFLKCALYFYFSILKKKKKQKKWGGRNGFFRVFFVDVNLFSILNNAKNWETSLSKRRVQRPFCLHSIIGSEFFSHWLAKSLFGYIHTYIDNACCFD